MHGDGGALVMVIFIVIMTLGCYMLYRKYSNSLPDVDATVTEFVDTEKFENNKVRLELSKPEPLVCDKAWVARGRVVEIGGYRIAHGLFYCGEGLYDGIGYQAEPALIDPKMEVSPQFDRPLIESIGYWPSYSKLSPAARGIYLSWLSSGAKNPHIEIGFVFLYFYGLERRALFDVDNSHIAKNDVKDIVYEVKRLLQIYGYNNSFAKYARSFLDAVDIKQMGKSYLLLTDKLDRLDESPLLLQLVLTGFANNHRPLPVKLALTWLKTKPLKTALTRCTQEFSHLFAAYYQKKFGAGIVLKTNNSKFKTTYHAASQSLRDAIDLGVGDLAELSNHGKPLEQLSRIADQCADELESYSRYLGRNSQQRDSIEALVLLPVTLINDVNILAINNSRTWCLNHLNNGDEVRIDCTEFFQQFPLLRGKILDKKSAQALSHLLFQMGFGIEPDIAFGGIIPTEGNIIMFKLHGQATQHLSPQYSAATVLLNLVAVVASADGEISRKENEAITEKLELWLNLAPYERQRLMIHRSWLLSDIRGLAGLKQKLQHLDKSQSEAVAKLLVGIAESDGVISPKEVKTLVKIYELLGLSKEDFFAHVHKSPSEPVLVTNGVAGSSYAIPKPPEVAQDVMVTLDKRSLQSKMAETMAVSAMLSSIFSEQNIERDLPALKEKRTAHSIAGLDEKFSDFVEDILFKTTWKRSELLAKAKEKKLMLDGAIDAINEAFFESHQKPLFEGFDPVVIDKDLVKEVRV